LAVMAVFKLCLRKYHRCIYSFMRGVFVCGSWQII
jgi:hypothetical protein